MRLVFAIAFGCVGTAACCLHVASSESADANADGGDGGRALVWPPGTAFIATGDLNQDGVQDLALLTASFYDAGGIYLYYGLPDGGLSQGPIIDLPMAGLFELVVSDLNGDGWPDLIAAGELQIAIAMNQSDGGFAVYSSSEWYYPLRGVQAADFDGSGRADLVVGSYQFGVTLFVEKGGVPNFSAPISFPVPPSTDLGTSEGSDILFGLGVGDLDGEGHTDIVSNELGGTGDAYLIVRRGIGDGGFLASDVYPSTPKPPLDGIGIEGPIVVADVNGDGLPDIVAATSEGLALRLGLGGGRLGNEIDVPGNPLPHFGTTTIVVVNSLDAGQKVITGGSWMTCGSTGGASSGHGPTSRLPMAFVNDGGGSFLAGVPFSATQSNPGPVATWTPAGASRPVLVLGDRCAPRVNFISE